MNIQETSSRTHILRNLFFSTLYLSAFTFGGGYVIVTLMKKKFVDEYHWIDEPEMLDLIAIAQSSPGAIAVNGAIVIGYKLAGLLGVLTAVLGTIIPPFILLSVVSVCYTAFRSLPVISWMLKGMQAGVGAVIVDVVFDMASGIVKKRQYTAVLLMVVAFVASYCFQVSAVILVLCCLFLGLVLTLLREKGGHR